MHMTIAVVSNDDATDALTVGAEAEADSADNGANRTEDKGVVVSIGTDCIEQSEAVMGGRC